MAERAPKQANRYTAIIERLFFNNFKKGSGEVSFVREEIEIIAAKLGIKLPKNLGDIVYSFRYRNDLPESVAKMAPVGKTWVIRPAGKGKYKFVAGSFHPIAPNLSLFETKIPDATPGIIDMYAMSDEQALLAKLRYNRLLDIFTGLTCCSLQSHFRTTVDGMGQVETDEIYVGLDRRGVHYVIPVQAKGWTDRLNVVQIEQDIAVCAEKFPNLVCKPVAAQFMAGNLIALFAFEEGDSGVGLIAEKHYRLVPAESVTVDDLKRYGQRSDDQF
jgi:hypothetical protein